MLLLLARRLVDLFFLLGHILILPNLSPGHLVTPAVATAAAAVAAAYDDVANDNY